MLKYLLLILVLFISGCFIEFNLGPVNYDSRRIDTSLGFLENVDNLAGVALGDLPEDFRKERFFYTNNVKLVFFNEELMVKISFKDKNLKLDPLTYVIARGKDISQNKEVTIALGKITFGEVELFFPNRLDIQLKAIYLMTLNPDELQKLFKKDKTGRVYLVEYFVTLYKN